MLIAEFLRFACDGGATATSPIAAHAAMPPCRRAAVAAGVLVTASLRGNGGAQDIPELPAALVEYFNAGQPAHTAK